MEFRLHSILESESQKRLKYSCGNEMRGNVKEWTPIEIKSRGLELLAFMEKRWDINLGDESTKIKLLNLEFLAEAQ